MTEEPKKFTFDVNAVFAFLYLMYQTNMISRMNLKQMMNEIRKDWPDDVVKYLLEETMR